MRHRVIWLAVLVLAAAPGLWAQDSAMQKSEGKAQVYWVHFVQAVPGKAPALRDALSTPTADAPMASHMLVLRHTEGAPWDFVVIAHEGDTATVEIPEQQGPPAEAALREWHEDTYAAGPSWGEFAKAMGIGSEDKAGEDAVYIVSTYRPLPGHEPQLWQTLERIRKADARPGRTVLLRHLEGAAWRFLNITRYDSWTDLAAQQTDTGAEERLRKAGFTQNPGLELREHMIGHEDTIAIRIPLKGESAGGE